MSFLKNSRTNLKTDNNNHTFLEEFVSLIVYICAVISYFIKQNLNNTLTMTFLAIVTMYFAYNKYKNKGGDTENIGGMEVPRLRDNYDLSI